MVHKHKSFLSIIWLLVTLASLSSAFVPNAYVPPAGSKAHLTPSYETKTLQHDLVQPFLTIRTSRRSNALPTLNGVAGAIGDIFRTYGDLVVGTFTVFCAVTPYMAGILFPKLLNRILFFRIYKTEKELAADGQDQDLSKGAESMWKCMYASMGFLLTLVTFLQANTYDLYTGPDVLRDQFAIWALFFYAATYKLRYEDVKLEILGTNRFMAQVAHLIFAGFLTISVFIGPKAKIITRLVGLR